MSKKSSTTEQILRYQKDIDKCPENADRMLRCIHRLFLLPVTVEHLQATLIGKSVNALRKYGGEVGEAAKALILKWKELVVAREHENASETEKEITKNRSSHQNNRDKRSRNEDDSNRNNTHKSNSEKRSYHKETRERHSDSVSRDHDERGHKKKYIEVDRRAERDHKHHISKLARSRDHSSREKRKAASDSDEDDSAVSHKRRRRKSNSSSEDESNASSDRSAESSEDDQDCQNGVNDEDSRGSSESETHYLKKVIKTEPESSDEDIKVRPSKNNNDVNDDDDEENSASENERTSRNSTADSDEESERRSEVSCNDDVASRHSQLESDAEVSASDQDDSEGERPAKRVSDSNSHHRKSSSTLDRHRSNDNTHKHSSSSSSSSKNKYSHSGSSSSSQRKHDQDEISSRSSHSSNRKENIHKSESSRKDKANSNNSNSDKNNSNNKDHKSGSSRDDKSKKPSSSAAIKDEKHKKSSSSSSSSSHKDRHHRDSEKSSSSKSSNRNDAKSSSREDPYKKDIKKEKELERDEGSKSHNAADVNNRGSSKVSSKSCVSVKKEEICMKPNKNVKIKVEKMSGDEDGIDGGSGASFADALLGVPMKKKKKIIASPSKRPEVTSSPSLNRNKESSSNEHKESSRHSTSSKPTKPIASKSNEPDLLSRNIKLEPLEVDLAATLPEISANYHPLHSYSPPPEKSQSVKRGTQLTTEEALTSILSTKGQRMKVYSGNKCYGAANIPSLFNLCIQVLQENIEALEYTGGVPYDLLKPVLERATAEQLYSLEHHNPYLIEDTGIHWEFHCNKDFRGKKRDELESWRDLYLRCYDERERKLKALTANITHNIAASTPVRKTKLAYVDAVVKPPRNVAKTQAKFGTSAAVKHDIVSKAMVGGHSASGETARSVVPPPPQARSSNNQSAALLKKKKAPLMMKALQLIKGNRYKR